MKDTAAEKAAAQPTTCTELRDEMLVVFAGLRSGALAPELAKELSNAAGKIFKSASVQLVYAELRKEKPEIPFLK